MSEPTIPLGRILRLASDLSVSKKPEDSLATVSAFLREVAAIPEVSAPSEPADDYLKGFADGAGIYRANAAKAISERAAIPEVKADSTEAEPVGAIVVIGGESDIKEVRWNQAPPPHGTPLYTHPPKDAPSDALDAKRYRLLRSNMCLAGNEFHILNLRPTHLARDARIDLDAAIDAILAAHEGTP